MSVKHGTYWGQRRTGKISKKKEKTWFGVNEINETLAELYPRTFTMFFHKSFIRTEYNEAIEACKDRTARPNEYRSID